MELGQDKLLRVNRDEARVVRTAATLAARMDIVTTLAHYPGARLGRHYGTNSVRVVERETTQNELEGELKSLPTLIEQGETRAIKDVRYVYGPKLAEAAMHVVSIALEDNLLVQTIDGTKSGELTAESRKSIDTAHKMMVDYSQVREDFLAAHSV